MEETEEYCTRTLIRVGALWDLKDISVLNWRFQLSSLSRIAGFIGNRVNTMNLVMTARPDGLLTQAFDDVRADQIGERQRQPLP